MKWFDNAFFWIENEAKIFLSMRLALIAEISKSALSNEIYKNLRYCIQNIYKFEHERYSTNLEQFWYSIDKVRENICNDVSSILLDDQSKKTTQHHIFPMMRKSWWIFVDEWLLNPFYQDIRKLKVLFQHKIEYKKKNNIKWFILWSDNKKNIISLSYKRHNVWINEYFYSWSLLIQHQLLLLLLDTELVNKIDTIRKETSYLDILEKKIISWSIEEIYHPDVYQFVAFKKRK